MDGQSQLANLLAASDPISNLNDQLPVSPAVSLDEFVNHCSELISGMDPQKHLSPEERSILFPKSKLWVTPFQLWEGWRMLNQRERTGLRGGLQASSAGLGKSSIILVAVLLRARIFESARQVKEFWSTPASCGNRPKRARPAQHLPSTAHGSGLRCPSQKEGDIVCYCVGTSKSRGFVDSGIAPLGVSLIQAPVPVVEQWISIFRDAVLDPSAYNIVIIYPNVPIGLKRDYARITNSLSKPGARGSYYAPETFIFCSSHTNPKVLGTFTTGEISVGVMFSDESHRAMRLESRSMAIAESQATVGDGVDLWLVSATPIRLLQDFELPVRIFSNSSDLARAASMANMVTAYTTARSSDEDMDAFWEHWSKVFDSKLVLRNTVTSQFCGRAITSLQIVEPDRVWFDTPQEHFEDVQEVAYLAREVIRDIASVAKEREEVFRLDYASDIDARLHFVSLFPGAANLIREKHGLNVEEESIRKKIEAIKVSNKLKVEKIESYQQHLEQVSRGSPKLEYILGEIGRMRADREEREGDPRVQSTLRRENLSMKKMVIITPTLGTAVFLYLFLLKRVPDLNPVCFHTSAPPSDREAALNSFQSLTARKNAKHSYILVTPFSTGGTGLNLQSANYQILVYPPSTRNTQTQAFARTNRTGQRLAVHHKVLITQDSPADRINVVNSAGRLIRNDPFEMSRRLVLAELDGSKKIQRLEDWGYEVNDFEEPDLAEYFVKQTFPTIDNSQFQACRVSLPGIPTLDDFIHFSSDTIASSTFCVTEAWNDEDKRPRHEKLTLRDIILGIWVFRLNRAVRDLTTIMYCTVVEKTLSIKVRRRVYILMTEEKTSSLVVHREGGSPQESEAFDTLLNEAPFCVGAQKMLDEYPEFAGTQIESFEFDVPAPDPYSEEPFFNFRINFQ